MKMLQWAFLAVVSFLVLASPALAYVGKLNEDGKPTEAAGPDHPILSGAAIAAGLGMGLTLIGAGIGLGRIGSAAVEGMARQPEVAPRIQVAMIIVAAMLEGATLASVVLCFVVGGKATW
jgi:F-type H+-transporting ATPase subunit c